MRNLFFRFSLYFIILISGVLLDLGTKNWIFEKLGEPGAKAVWWIVPQIFGFETSLNQGALFGLGQGQITLFVLFSFIALFGIVMMIVFDKMKSFFFTFILGLISAGIIGNLWDRLGLHQMVWSVFQAETGQCSGAMIGQPIYAVRDWILVLIGNYHWPNFNLADSFLVSGAVLIALLAFFGKKANDEKKEDLPNDLSGQDQNKVNEPN